MSGVLGAFTRASFTVPPLLCNHRAQAILVALLVLACGTNAAAAVVTCEVRWFFDGPAPSAVKSWFGQDLPGDQLASEPARQDLYLIWHGRDDLGLKLREGDLELKARTSAERITSADERMNAMEECWAKSEWEYDRADNDKVIASFQSPSMKGARATIQKSRQRRKYELNSSGQLVPIAIKERRDRAVIVELTELSMHGRQYWTLGVDLIGEQQDVPELRRGVLQSLLKAYPGPPLRIERSFGYPRFIIEMF